MRARYSLLLVCALGSLAADPLSLLQRMLEQNERSARPNPQSAVTSLRNYLERQPFDWKEMPSRYGGIHSLWVRVPGTRETGAPLLLAARIRGSTVDVLTLSALLAFWAEEPPRRDVMIVFLGEEDIYQPERASLSREPFARYVAKPYQASINFLDSELEQNPLGAIYLRSEEKAWLNLGHDTPFEWGRWVWSQLSSLSLPLFGGMGDLSESKAPKELEEVYAQRGIPLVVASLPFDVSENTRLLAQLANYEGGPHQDRFFYSFVWNGRLRYLSGTTVLGALFVMLSGWLMILLLRPRRLTLPLLEWLHFSFTLLVLTLCYLLIWVVVDRLLFPSAGAFPARTMLLQIFSTLVVFHLLLFPLHRYSPRPLSCLRFYEGLSLLTACILALVEPLLAVAQLPILLAAGGLNSLSRNVFRRILWACHGLYLLGFYLFLLLGPPTRLLFAGDSWPTQLFLLVVWMPVFFLFLGTQKIARRRLPRLAWAQHWFNLLLFSLLTLSAYLSTRHAYNSRPKQVHVTYLFDWDGGGDAHATALLEGNTSLHSLLFYLGPDHWERLQGTRQVVPVKVSLPAVTSKLETRRIHRRQFYRLELNHPARVRTLQVRIALPASSVITSHPRIFADDQSTILRVDNPKFPLVLEWSSTAEENPSKIQLAASLAEVPFVTTVVAPGPLRIRKSCQLYWQVSLS